MHRNADLDALASAYYLKEIYGNCKIAGDGLDRFSKKIARKFDIEVVENVENDFEKIIVVDTPSREQLGKFKPLRIDEVYDHHESNSISAPKRFVFPEYSSCAEMLYNIRREKVSKKAYTLLIGGIISDTKWFRNANEKTFETLTRILREGKIKYEEVKSLFEFDLNYGERISILKGFQRAKYRTKGDKIICVTRVGANESVVANSLLSVGNIVFVASQRKEEVRITARSREKNLLKILEVLSRDFSCSYGGHPNAAGARCVGDSEAILNALIEIAEK